MPRRDHRPVDLRGLVLTDAAAREPVDLGALGAAAPAVLTAIRHRA